MLAFLTGVAVVQGLSSFSGLSGAPRAVQKQWKQIVETLEEELQEEYYTVKTRWKQEFECAACRAVMGDLGEVVESLAGWTSSQTSEDAYLIRFNAMCEKAEKKFGVAVIDRYNEKQPWYEQTPISTQSLVRIVDRENEPTLNTPFLRESLGTLCNTILDSQFNTLINLTFPTSRFATYSMCVKELKLCNEEWLTTLVYSSPSKSDIERFREKGKMALQKFWNVLANKTDPERRRIRCMACDVTLAHIQDEIGWRNPNVQKRQIHPSIAQLVKTCGSLATWQPWGLGYNFWSETVVSPYFLKDKNFSRSAVKLQADVVPILLFDICKEVAETSKTDLDGYEEPIPNCHNMPWCQFTEWESDSQSENTYQTVELERDKAKTKWLRIGKQSLEPEETDEEVEEEERREAALAAKKKAERAAKRTKSAAPKLKVDL